MAKESSTFNKRSKFKQCPRCNELLKKNSKFCNHCGIVFENQKKIFSIQGLHFGKKKESSPIKVVDDTSITYSQNLSKTTYLLIKFYNLFFFIVGAFALLMLFLPLFSSHNIGLYINEVSTSYFYRGAVYYCVKFEHNGKSIYVHTSPCFSSHFLSKIKLEEYNNKKVMVLYDSDLDKVYVIKKV